MKIVIDIPDNEIPKRQEIMQIDLHFIDGKVCECTYPFEEIDNPPTVEPRIEYGTDGQPCRLFMSDEQVVPDTLQGWRLEKIPRGDV